MDYYKAEHDPAWLVSLRLKRVKIVNQCHVSGHNEANMEESIPIRILLVSVFKLKVISQQM